MLDEKTPRKDNNFGALRLLFASVVILSHSPEILDGNRSRELLTNVLGITNVFGVTFGILGVDGFFIVSGYLITKSFLSSPTLFDYLKRRFLRIYPAFVVSFWLCLVVLAPVVGAGLSPFHPAALVRNVVRASILLHPDARGSLPGMPFPVLNASMWTIPYEFHCYILVMFAGVAGLFKGSLRYFLLVVVLAALAMSIFAGDRLTHGVAAALLGTPDRNLQLVPMFGAGVLYALFQRSISFSHALAVIAAAALTICLFFVPVVVPLAIGVLGSYLIFWFAFRCPVLPVSRFANNTDLSYGIYLYAWPIQSTIAFFTARSINPWALSAISLALAAGAAWASWTFIEKPALALAHRRTTGFQHPQLSANRPHEGAT